MDLQRPQFAQVQKALAFSHKSGIFFLSLTFHIKGSLNAYIFEKKKKSP